MIQFFSPWELSLLEFLLNFAPLSGPILLEQGSLNCGSQATSGPLQGSSWPVAILAGWQWMRQSVYCNMETGASIASQAGNPGCRRGLCRFYSLKLGPIYIHALRKHARYCNGLQQTLYVLTHCSAIHFGCSFWMAPQCTKAMHHFAMCQQFCGMSDFFDVLVPWKPNFLAALMQRKLKEEGI